MNAPFMFNTDKPIFTRELKIGIVGGGHLTRALVSGWRRRKAPLVVTVIERNADKRQSLREQFDVACFANLANLPSGLDMLLFAIKPRGVLTLCTEFSPHAGMVVSLAPGISLDAIAQALACPKTQLARAMPNLPVAYQQGVTALYAETPRAAQQAQILFSAVGAVISVNQEKTLDVLTAVTGSGPAYIYYFIEMLFAARGIDSSNSEKRRGAAGGVIRAGRQLGHAARAGSPAWPGAGLHNNAYNQFARALAEAIISFDFSAVHARQLAGKLLIGTGTILGHSVQSPRELLDAVATPGGITEAALSALTTPRFKGLVYEMFTKDTARTTSRGEGLLVQELGSLLGAAMQAGLAQVTNLSL